MRSAHAPLRSRRTLLYAAAAFALVQAALAGFVMAHPFVARGDLWQRRINRYRQRTPHRPGTLVAVQIGSSRTECGIRGQAAEPWLSERLGRPVVLYNMGSCGSGPAANLINLRRTLNDGIRPRLLLIEVLPPLLLTDDERLAELNAERMPASELRHDEAALVASLAGPVRPYLWGEWLLDQAVPANTHRQTLMSMFYPTLLTAEARRDGFRSADESGYVPPKRLDRKESARALEFARESYEAALHDHHLSRRRLGLIGRTIEEARREGMAVALVVMPEGPTFRSWYPPGKWEAILAAVEEVARRHDTPLINLREALDEEDFFDSHHATKEGAAKLTLELARRIEPLLRAEAEKVDAP
jgi:hypothetical protein